MKTFSRWRWIMSIALAMSLCLTMGPVLQDLRAAPEEQEKPGKEESKEKEPLPPSRNQIQASLRSPGYKYNPVGLNDPFLPFTAPSDEQNIAKTGSAEEPQKPVEPERPLTPLQKMTISEIEKGLKAILWGEMGRRAVIQDSTGKGYIVSPGTPVAGPTGVITSIYKDRIVIRQEVWDKDAKKMVAKNNTVKLKKEGGRGS